MSGLILPANSPLVQFRVDRPHKDNPESEIQLPSLIWIDRSRAVPCRRKCGEMSYPIPREIANRGVKEGGGDWSYSGDPTICPHQGVFIE